MTYSPTVASTANGVSTAICTAIDTNMATMHAPMRHVSQRERSSRVTPQPFATSTK
eukprot:CAMPEP_0119058434 /NCGR_PEP_ID=MMETSP1178-20130426/2771_1 /TAXON_ID=33656 /ORGANISM="unid sp, Strain CCMP2000" /LENGTH=55 /DNA_ID=CAMNT_0007039369 /DNA_START=226 /DNA_END=390 /DNA_ORIENTATION=+